jgi:hypothetical protein
MGPEFSHGPMDFLCLGSFGHGSGGAGNDFPKSWENHCPTVDIIFFQPARNIGRCCFLSSLMRVRSVINFWELFVEYHLEDPVSIKDDVL